MAGASEKKADASGRADEHVDPSTGARVPTPDPKDQTGDPDVDNPAMRELRERQKRGNSHEA
jgi:hypothetical protein